jgi:hypothetical protein
MTDTFNELQLTVKSAATPNVNFADVVRNRRKKSAHALVPKYVRTGSL